MGISSISWACGAWFPRSEGGKCYSSARGEGSAVQNLWDEERAVSRCWIWVHLVIFHSPSYSFHHPSLFSLLKSIFVYTHGFCRSTFSSDTITARRPLDRGLPCVPWTEGWLWGASGCWVSLSPSWRWIPQGWHAFGQQQHCRGQDRVQDRGAMPQGWAARCVPHSFHGNGWGRLLGGTAARPQISVYFAGWKGACDPKALCV